MPPEPGEDPLRALVSSLVREEVQREMAHLRELLRREVAEALGRSAGPF
jgi:hypothetical protein